MTRHIRRASALFLAGALFSAGAWGQADTTIRQWAVGKIAIASEYFGTSEGRKIGRDLDDDTSPKVILTVHAASDTATSASIGQGNTARITYTLDGATFAETVSASNLRGYNLGAGASIDSEVVSGGSVGDASVTIEVEVQGAAIAADTGTYTASVGGNDVTRNSNRLPNLSLADDTDDESLPKLVFQVPLLQTDGQGAIFDSDADGKPTARGVAITSEIAVRRTRGIPFPDEIQGKDADFETGDANIGDIGADPDDIELAQSQVYDTLTDGLAFNWAPPYGSKVEVNVSDRKVIIPFGQAVDDPSDGLVAALKVGTINVNRGGSAVTDLGGEDPAVETTGLMPDEYELGDGLSGDAVVTVFGRFQTGDQIYLGDKSMGIQGGVASASMGIEDLLQSEGQDVIYVPGGVDNLKPGTFIAVGSLDFNDSDNDMPSAGPDAIGASVGTVAYRRYSNQGYAYGVVKGGGTDQSFVRMGCTALTGCHVFLDCTDQSGMEYFGEYGNIAPNATSVASSDMIASALDGGWSKGRGSCTMISKGGLEVQHMVRSGHTLVNSSLVTNKLVAPVPTTATISCGTATTPTGAATAPTLDADADGFIQTDELQAWVQTCSGTLR